MKTYLFQCSSPEPYISQHDSFTESDSLFAEMDIQNLPDLPQAHTTNKFNVISNPKSFVHGLSSQGDMFGPSNSSSNGTVYEPSTKLNAAYRTPLNFKTLSQVLSDHNYSPPDPADDKPIVTSRSLKDKFRKAMQQNAKVSNKLLFWLRPNIVKFIQIRSILYVRYVLCNSYWYIRINILING